MKQFAVIAVGALALATPASAITDSELEVALTFAQLPQTEWKVIENRLALEFLDLNSSTYVAAVAREPKLTLLLVECDAVSGQQVVVVYSAEVGATTELGSTQVFVNGNPFVFDHSGPGVFYLEANASRAIRQIRGARKVSIIFADRSQLDFAPDTTGAIEQALAACENWPN